MYENYDTRNQLGSPRNGGLLLGCRGLAGSGVAEMPRDGGSLLGVSYAASVSVAARYATWLDEEERLIAAGASLAEQDAAFRRVMFG